MRECAENRTRRIPVLEPLDIFKKEEDGTYVWKATAENLEVATKKVKRLASIAPGDYMIFNQTTQTKKVIPIDAT